MSKKMTDNVIHKMVVKFYSDLSVSTQVSESVQQKD